MIDLAATTLFLLFLLGSVGVRRASSETRLLAIRIFVIFLFGALAFTNLTQIDLWPFTRFIPASFRPNPDRETSKIEFVVVDSKGRERPLDMRVFSPVTPWVMEIWVVEKTSIRDQDALMSPLLALANEGRERLARDESIGPQRFLGDAAIPFWLLHGEFEEVSSEPWVGLRVYETRFIPREYGGRLEQRKIEGRNLLRETKRGG